MRIGIDMGHTLSGSGTSANGYVRESDMNRQVGKRLMEMLIENKHTVVNCTVDYSNNDLADRVARANAQPLDLFLSIHLNAFKKVTQEMGVETYSYSSTGTGASYAKKVQSELVEAIGWKNRGAKTASYYVLRNTNAPAVLVELGFCDSKGDMDKWDTEKISAALFKAMTGNKYIAPKTEDYTVKITANVLNVRKGPGASYPITTTVKKDQVFTIVEEEGNWGKLKSGAGWISLAYTDKKQVASAPAPVQKETCDEEVKRYSEKGKCTITTSTGIKLRDKPCTCHGKVQGTYAHKESVNYDLVVLTEKYVWISWISSSTKARRYMPIKDRKTNERWGNCV